MLDWRLTVPPFSAVRAPLLNVPLEEAASTLSIVVPLTPFAVRDALVPPPMRVTSEPTLNVPSSKMVLLVPVSASFIAEPAVPKLIVPVPALITFELDCELIVVLRSSVRVVGSLELIVRAFTPVRTSVSVEVLSLMVTDPLLVPRVISPMVMLLCPRLVIDTGEERLKVATSVVPVLPGKVVVAVLQLEPISQVVAGVPVPVQLADAAPACKANPNTNERTTKASLCGFMLLK